MTSGTCRTIPSVDCGLIHLIYREKAGTSVAGNNAVSPVDSGDASDDDKPKGKAKGNFSAFAALGMEDSAPQDEEDEDFGGLMVCFGCSSVRKVICCLTCTVPVRHQSD